MKSLKTYLVWSCFLILFACVNREAPKEKTASDILGNPEYLAISYGGYRDSSRDVQPTIAELKEDMQILFAMGIRVLRTYNVHLPHAANLLKAIAELKKDNPDFEMYVMLGAWIDCKDAWTAAPNHNDQSPRNAIEIAMAVELVKQHPDIVKILAVGNEAMVKWAGSYYVQPEVILKWVNHLQNLKKEGELPANLWITSSDDFASWGGADSLYHTKDLEKLYHAVDYISMHTYPYHNTHYNPEFWLEKSNDTTLSKKEKVDAAMQRALEFAKGQYDAVKNYMQSIGVQKPIHIGETGWSSISDGFYGNEGSNAADEYKQGKYYEFMREWTNDNNISCFYFEAFDEQWKDAQNVNGSENHFGLINLKGQVKYPLWDAVDKQVFKGITRNGKTITKTYAGDLQALMEHVEVPPLKISTKKLNEGN